MSSTHVTLDTPFWRETFALHRGGKLEVASRVPLEDRADLAKAYTPGVAG
ncbi:MAG: NAD-dependent malic enzyme, partial [Actinomycetales bacterium]|nr:NAD-dependent malic enzyme [Actinomycetales bacterium]